MQRPRSQPAQSTECAHISSAACVVSNSKRVARYFDSRATFRSRPTLTRCARQKLLLRLPFDRRRARILHLEPTARAAAAVRRALPLRDHAFEPQLAGVLKHDRTVTLDVVIEPNALASPGQDVRQSCLADFEGARRRSAPFSSIRSKAYRN